MRREEPKDKNSENALKPTKSSVENSLLLVDNIETNTRQMLIFFKEILTGISKNKANEEEIFSMTQNMQLSYDEIISDLDKMDLP